MPTETRPGLRWSIDLDGNDDDGPYSSFDAVIKRVSQIAANDHVVRVRQWDEREFAETGSTRMEDVTEAVAAAYWRGHINSVGKRYDGETDMIREVTEWHDARSAPAIIYQFYEDECTATERCIPDVIEATRADRQVDERREGVL